MFEATFSIESPNGDMVLQFENYTFDECKYTEMECKDKGLTYALPLKATIDLIFTETGEIRRKILYMGDIPMMTERGTFIINGAERVVVSQIHRSPGVIFSYETKEGMHTARIIPDRGSWLEFELENKKELLYIRIDRKRRILATLLLRAIGFQNRDEIIKLFYKTKKVTISDDVIARGDLNGKHTAKAYFGKEENEKIVKAGERLIPTTLDTLLRAGHQQDRDHRFRSRRKPQLHGDHQLPREGGFRQEPRQAAQGRALEGGRVTRIYSIIHPGEPTTLENAERDISTLFFDTRRYDLGDVGRYKLNKRFDYSEEIKDKVLQEGGHHQHHEVPHQGVHRRGFGRQHRPPGEPQGSLGRRAPHEPAARSVSRGWSGSPRSACPSKRPTPSGPRT